MRVVVATYGSRGDVEPMAGLAVALRAAGAQALVCAPPDEEFARRLAELGVPFVGLGPAVRELAAGGADPFRVAEELVAARFGTLAAVAEGCDVLVAGGLMPAGVRSVAEALGIRYVYACCHPFELPSPHYPPSPRPGRPFPEEVSDNRELWAVDAERVDALYGAAVNRHRAAAGLPPVRDVRDRVFTERPWLAADPVLAPWRGLPEVDVVQTGAWILPDERPLPGELTAFLDAGEPPVHVGFGSMAAPAVRDAARVAVQAVRALGRRVVLARGWAGAEADGDDCLVVGEVNQQALFRRVAAVVHHGGAGTTTAAARAGAPQVVLPRIVDQPHWARRVAELGIGAAHDGAVPDVASLAAALRVALDPRTRARAREVAGTVRTDGAAVAAKMLVDGSAEEWRAAQLRAENRRVRGLYDRLEAQRELAARRLREIHLQDNRGTLQSRMERDTMEIHHTRRLWELHAAENGLCFGRIENADGERRYIGRIALADDDHEPVLTDWRAPAAEPFYRATPAAPGGVVARRHLRSKGRTVVDFDDDAFGVGERSGARLSGEGALLASLTAARTGRMGDIVATIQAEQDRIIRSELGGVLVVQGGPGTGKTVVALHRAAYLLYTHRERLARSGVLVIGPNTTFLRYIDQVLPALGESEVVLSSIGVLYPGVTAAGPDTPEAAAVKGDGRMARVLADALAGMRQLPEDSWTITVGRRSSSRYEEVEVGRAVCERARAAAHASREPHNPARAALVERLSSELALRIARDRGGTMDLDAVADLADGLVAEPEFQALADRLWPPLSPEQLLTALYGSAQLRALAMPDFTAAERAALARGGHGQQAAAGDWTTADVPLLDEAAELLGPLPVSTARLRAEAAAKAAAEAEELEFARLVLEDFGEGLAEIDARKLTRQYRGEETSRPLAERAAQDRTWAFGHVIVDEAQELSPMAWRLLTRRCPGRSMTIVGDLAQTGAPAGLSSWGQALEEYTAGRWRTVELTVNYRTPAEIMRVAEGVLGELGPGLAAPRAVRDGGTRPWSLRIPADDAGAALRAAVEREIAALDGGRLAVVVPPRWPAGRLAGLPGVAMADDGPSALDSPAVVMTAEQSKGLEFDAVLVVEPADILAAHPRGLNDLYVALTRATRTLGVLHSRDLPDLLTGLDPR